MKSRRLRRLFIGLILLALAVGLSWSPACLWYAKRQAMQKFAHNSDTQILNIALAPEVRQIKPVEMTDELRVSVDKQGYRWQLPAAQFQAIINEDHWKFDSPKMTVFCSGTMDLKGMLIKAPKGNTTFDQYIAQINPYQMLVDIFNSRPMDIPQQASMGDLQKHLYLLLIKSELMSMGSDKNWEQIDTGHFKGIIAGNTSSRGVFVDLYLPDKKVFAHMFISPKPGVTPAVTMEEIYQVLAEIQIQPLPADDTSHTNATQPTSVTQPINATQPGPLLPAPLSPTTRSATQPSTQPETAESLLRRASEEEFGDLGGCVETIEAARAVGVDFQDTVAGCLKRDRSAMHTLFRLSVDAHLDAASAEGYAAVVGKLMESLGDDFFGSALAAELPATRQEIRDHLYNDQGAGEITTFEAVDAKWPRTFTDSK